MKNFLNNYFLEVEKITQNIDKKKINEAIQKLKELKKISGRLFIIGVGGSAANASHAVNDFRKLCEIEAYTPTDNVSEISARTNDEGWDRVFIDYLKVSKISSKDILLILSVGGGDKKRDISVNIIKALEFTNKNNIFSIGIVGKKDGYTAKNANLVIDIPFNDNSLITPLAESFQSVVLHAIVSDNSIKVKSTKW